MGQEKYTQAQQVVDTLRKIGGYATLGDLYHLVDTKLWATKTPNESIRRIVQQSDKIFKIQPGLWALEECRDNSFPGSAALVYQQYTYAAPLVSGCCTFLVPFFLFIYKAIFNDVSD